MTLSLVSIHSSVHSADSGEGNTKKRCNLDSNVFFLKITLSLSLLSQDEGLEDAGIGGEDGATGVSYSPAHEIEVFSPSHKPTKRKTSISPPSYFGKVC